MLDELVFGDEAPASPRPRLLPTAPEPEALPPSPSSEAVDSPPVVVAGQTALFADSEAPVEKLSLAERFGGVPPFSVLDARAGYWTRRKAEWLALGIQSELGRGDDILWGHEGRKVRDHSFMARRRAEQRREDAAATLDALRGTSRREADLRSNLTGAAPLPEWATNGYAHIAPGTSIFDPVVCELAYRWFTPGPASSILDPFAGGSVRGIVAAVLGHHYTGIDLSQRQVEANRLQAETIVPGPGWSWEVGDSRDLDSILAPQERFDLVFSCPPYYDLEVYSDDPADLSAAPTYEVFLDGYEAIIAAALRRLRDDRFAVFVVGELRDKRGFQVGLVADTVRLFRAHGASLYNEAVYLQQPGTLPLRVRRQMDVGRKLGRAHQAVLVFWKGAKAPRWERVMGAEEAS